LCGRLCNKRSSWQGGIQGECEETSGHKPDINGLGGKNIGVFGSFVYVINQIFGPGMVALPMIFQQSGWVVPTVTLVFFLFISAWSATALIEAIRLMPGNSKFGKRVEYATAVEYYFGRKLYYAFQILLNLCLQSINIASITVCAQSLDNFIVFLFKKSFALRVYPHPGFVSGNYDQVYSWYGGDTFSLYFTLGYIGVVAFYSPWAFFPLDENIKFQFASFTGLVLSMCEFMYWWFGETKWYPEAVPAFGHSYAQVVGVFITSWAFVMVVPSWVNEKKEHVSINKTIWLSCLASVIGYLLFAVMCALSNPGLQSDNILRRMGDKRSFILTRVVSYLFSFIIIGPGIPVYSISTRYNLFVGKMCGKKMSYFWGCVAPWIIGFIFTGSSVFAQFLVWSSLLFTGFVNFLVPLAIYLKAFHDRQKMLISGDSSGSEVELLLYSDKDKVFPTRLQPWTKLWLAVLLAAMAMLIILQIVLSLYYQIALGENLCC
jgi:amino acid permease